MAKITIEGQNLLNSLDDDWGGQNNTQESQTIHGTTVPVGAEWGMNRGEVERFIKKRFRGAVGYLIWSQSVDQSNFYHLLGFATEADYELWNEDSEVHSDLLLVDIPLQISTVQGDSYGAYLFTSADTTANIVVAERELSIPLRFHAVRNSNGERLNMGAKGTLQIQRSMDNGSTWTTVGTLAGAIDSTDYSNTTTYTNIEIGQFLAEGRQLIRIRASFVYTDDNNQDRIQYSTYVTAASSITYTQLRLECQLDWNNAMQASQIKAVGFPISYQVYGAVAKTLHVEIDGQTTLSATYSLGADINGTVVTRDVADASDTYKIFNHGVHAVRAWLTASDGRGGTLTSVVEMNSFMVIDYATAGVNASKPFIMIQGMKSRVANFVQTTICEYSVFNPVVTGETITAGDTPVDVTFYLTEYTNSFTPSGSTTKYFESNSLVTPNTKQSLTTTIEIESESTSDINTYFRVWRKEAGTDYNLLLESQGVNYINVAVDNSDNFSPTLGASFILNPKVRNNTETNSQRILNAASNNAEVTSTWTGFDMASDGWVADANGVKVLRVLAGERLNIQLNPFAQFVSSPDSAMTMEFDISVRNVTDEDTPILKILESVGGNPRGLSIKPMEGNLYTKSSTIDNETNFRFCEDKRTHIVVNIHNNIRASINGDGLYDPNAYTPAQSIAIARVFINGNIEREITFSTSENDEFCTAAMSNGGIVLGQDGADIDIYGIRVYANRQLSAQDVVKNYIATLPTSDEKREVRAQNDIMTSGRVDVEKVKALGKRVLILHGLEVYQYRQTVASAWWEIFQYNADGSPNPDLSGTICKETGMEPKRQGSTANSYYYSNIQTKIDDGGTIQVAIADFHPSIQVSEPYTDNGHTYVDILGGNLGKNEPVMASAQAKAYPYENGKVSVPDGWIDGNGKYRGMGFMITEGTPLATKLVLKVNYASSMQSHLCAGTRLYNDLHTAVVGKNSLQTAVSSARVSKYTEPVYFFTQDGNNTPVYRGGGNFGAGKMDKPTWGYVKGLHPMFTMIEGSDNNYPLTDMRVPFITDGNCAEAVTYSTEDEGYIYNGLQCLDFDAGKTDDNDYPVSAITNRLAETWNFIYRHTPMIRYFVGSFSAFLLSSEAANTAYKYWCTDGADAFKLKRYNFVSGTWVDAGLWENGAYTAIDLRTDSMTAATYTASTHKADYEELNKELIGAIVADAKKYIGFYFNVDSLKFHYVFQNHFMAGTDNCSKNTYFVIDPVAKSVIIDNETRSCYLWELHQDDVDTIFITDNSGHSTKPYYIDRMHPYDDKDTSENPKSCYEGMNNGLFNLAEAMWEDTKELQSMMKSVFNAMVGLVTQEDNNKGITSTIWGCLEKYFFSIQHYYSQMAYNEQARIRYEWPELLGFVAGSSGGRPIRPITQSMGSQLEAETQYMLRRVIYMASYAAWGNFYDGGKTYGIGIADATESFSVQAFHLPPYSSNDNNYTFNVKPHQYIYPTGMLGQTPIDPHVRVAPNQTFSLNIGNTESNDTGITVLGANYYRSFGNVGDLSITPALTQTVRGKRLIEFIAEPTVTYTEGGKTVGAFRPQQIAFNAPLLRTISIKGSGIGGAANLSGLNRLESYDARGTYVYDVTLPSSILMREVYFPDTISRLVLKNLINLTTLYIGSVASLAILEADQVTVPQVDIMALILRAKNQGAPLTSVTANVNWTGCTTELLDYLVGLPTSVLRGTISVSSSQVVTLEQKKSYITRWGDIDNLGNALYITYTLLNISHVFITGQKYFGQSDVGRSVQFGITAEEGNNVAIVNGALSVTWSIASNPCITVNSNGRATINRLNTEQEGETRYTLTVVVDLIDGNTVSATWQVGAFIRLPRRGDFAFADGTFDDEILGGKTIVGFAYGSSDIYIDTEIAGKRLEVASFTTPKIRSTDNSINHNSLYWGISQGTGNIQIPQATVAEISQASGDIALINFAIGTTTDTASLQKTNLIINTAKAVINGYIKTKWATTDLTQYQESVTGEQYGLMQKVKAWANQSILPRNEVELGDMMEAFTLLMKLEGNADTSSNPIKRFWELFYPSAYCTYIYEPTIKEGETLHNSYKRFSWYMPAAAVFKRLWNMYHASRGKVNSTLPSSEYANEDNTVAETDYPLFANLLKRMEDVGYPTSTLVMPAVGSVWRSCTEVGASDAYCIQANNGTVDANWYRPKQSEYNVRAITTFDWML